MRKLSEIILNLIIWVIIVFLIFKFWEFGLAMGRQSPEGLLYPVRSFLVNLLIVIPGFLLNYCLFYFAVVPKLIAKNKVVQLVLLSLLGTLISATIISFISSINFSALRVSTFNNGFESIIIWSVLALFIGIIGGFLKGTVLWYNMIVEKRALEKKHLESKTALLLLKAQLNPHFLFNSLNNIDILIEENPKMASEYLKKLSDILRYVLYETKENETELAKEIAQIKSYIELQKIRTDNLRYVNFSLTGKLQGQKIAPVIFLPLIENAFKHSKNKSIDNAINIEFEVHEDKVKMFCRNYYETNQFEVLTNEGLGIKTVKQRLNLLYPEAHELIIDKTEHWFNVTLIII